MDTNQVHVPDTTSKVYKAEQLACTAAMRSSLMSGKATSLIGMAFVV